MLTDPVRLENRGKALALQAYARQAKDYEMEFMMIEIRSLAERRAGELLREMNKQGPGQHWQQKRSSDATVTIPPTLADIGITKDQSSRRLDAVHSYIKNRKARAEISHCQRWIELRLGEWLGPAKPPEETGGV